MAADADVFESSRMSFGDHLEELRGCLIRALVGVVLASTVCLIFGRELVEIICRPLLVVQHANGLQPRLQVLAPAGAFLAYLKIACLSGLILAMPWVLYQGWRFVASGLYARERRFVRTMVPASVGLFVVGVVFLYYIVLPIVLQFFISFNRRFDAPNLAPSAFQRLFLEGDAEMPAASVDAAPLRVPLRAKDPDDASVGDVWINTQTRRLMVKLAEGVWSAALERGTTAPSMHSEFALDFYISFVLLLALAFGIAFETPIVVFFLAWSGLVSAAAMRRGRRYVLLVVVIVAAVLTPPDVLSQLLLATPMYLLFELGLMFAGLATPTAARASSAEGAAPAGRRSHGPPSI